MNDSSSQSSWDNFGHVIRESIGLIGFWMTLRYVVYLVAELQAVRR